MNSFPYTNFHEINLDWILEQIKKGEKLPSDILAKIEALQKSLQNNIPLAVHATHRNFLDNTNFVDPVNQRGADYISGAGYPIDRWYVTGGTCSRIGSGLLLVAGAQDATFIQRIGNVKDGLYTAVFKVNGGNLYYIVRVEGSSVVALDESHSTSGAVSLIFRYNSERDCFEVGASVAAGYSAVFNNAALYPFECLEGNLPAYVSKGYVEELAECEHYYRVIPAGNLVFATNAPNQQYRTSSISFPLMRGGVIPTAIWQYYPPAESGKQYAFGVVHALRFLDASEVTLTVYNRRMYLTTEAPDLAGCAIEHLNLYLDAEF